MPRRQDWILAKIQHGGPSHCGLIPPTERFIVQAQPRLRKNTPFGVFARCVNLAPPINDRRHCGERRQWGPSGVEARERCRCWPRFDGRGVVSPRMLVVLLHNRFFGPPLPFPLAATRCGIASVRGPALPRCDVRFRRQGSRHICDHVIEAVARRAVRLPSSRRCWQLRSRRCRRLCSRQ